MFNNLNTLLVKVCQEKEIQELGITPNTHNDLVKRLLDFEKGEAMVVCVENMTGKVYKVIVRSWETVEGVWVALRRMASIPGRKINWRSIRAKYNLVYNSCVLDKKNTLDNYGIVSGSKLTFAKKLN